MCALSIQSGLPNKGKLFRDDEPWPSSSYAVKKVGGLVDRFFLAVWAGSLFTAQWDFRSRKDFEWVTMGLLHQ
jgi:hypothetical protein